MKIGRRVVMLFLACTVAGPLCAQNRGVVVADSQVDPTRRVALVIGNDQYQHLPKLRNAVADALAIKRELGQRQFDVIYRENATRRELNDAVEDFLDKLSSDAVGVVYYSGHGVQIDGTNYLLPTDLNATKAADVRNDALSLGRLLDRMAEKRAAFKLAIIDACRDNPFKSAGRGFGESRGLAMSNATGMLVVYAAGTNQTALDRLSTSDQDPNGLFTREFLKTMRKPGLKVQDVVIEVKLAVATKARSVGHVQTPAVYDESIGTFYFTGKARPDGAQAGPLPVAPQPKRVERRVTACSHLGVTAEWQGVEAPEQSNSCTYAAPPGCIILATDVQVHSDNNASQTTSIGGEGKKLTSIVKARPHGSAIDRRRGWMDITTVAVLECEE